ncbi:MAG: type II toxin-antitoxin system mRNA interferase toxin, RelE/StbE family [Candidatus Methylacidiphilaceae bacterium]
MGTLNYTRQFNRGYNKREKNGRCRTPLNVDLRTVFAALLADLLLEPGQRDHARGGEWKDRRHCHVKPDLVLIYRKPDANKLELVRRASHPELGLRTPSTHA